MFLMLFFFEKKMIEEIKKELKNKGEIYLKIKAVPNASKTEFKDRMADGTYKISVGAVPEKGKANTELIKYLVKEFGLDKKNIKLISGASSRLKLFKIVKNKNF